MPLIRSTANALTAVNNAASPYTMAASDKGLEIDGTSGVAVTLPDPTALANLGREIVLLLTTAGSVTYTTPAGTIGEGGGSTWSQSFVGQCLRLKVNAARTAWKVLSVL